MELAETSLASVLNAKGAVANIEQGLGKSAQMVAEMRKDAAELPGEFSDLQGILMSSVASGMEAGVSPEKMQKISAQAMAAGKAMAVPLDQAGRELALLFEGRAGAHNVFGKRLGIDAHKEYAPGKTFNKLDEVERVRIIEEQLGKFGPAIKAFSSTWDAQSSTLVDNVKMFTQSATKPLFEEAKETLTDINRWFDENQSTVDHYSRWVGSKFRDAFLWGKSTIQEWWPVISNFASSSYQALSSAWEKLEGPVGKVSDLANDFLSDPKNVDMIVSSATVGLDAVGRMAQTFDYIASIDFANLAWMGRFSGAISGVEAAARSQGGGAKFGAALDIGVGHMDEVGSFLVEAEGKWSTMVSGVVGATDAFAHSLSQGTASMYAVTPASNAVVAGFNQASGAAASFAAFVAAQSSAMTDQMRTDAAARDMDFLDRFNKGQGDTGGQGDAFMNAQKKDKERRAGGGGGGGQNIQKVEITVSSNQAPRQIARAVLDEIGALRRHPRSSAGVRNFAAAAGRR